MNIEGKSVLVTGASSGIGRATALMLARKGAANVVIVDRNAAGLEDVGAAIRGAGANAILKAADLTQVGEVTRVFEEADDETGGLDIVHNNAGIMSGPPEFPDMPIPNMVAVIQLNLIAMMVGTHVAVGRMRRRGAAGVIVNTSSTAAFGAMAPDPAYSTSKIGIVNFTQACKTLKDRFNIRVMAVCPGIVDTAIVPREAAWLKPALDRIKMLQPDDIARAVCDIVADDSQSGEYVIVQNDEPVTA